LPVSNSKRQPCWNITSGFNVDVTWLSSAGCNLASA